MVAGSEWGWASTFEMTGMRGRLHATRTATSGLRLAVRWPLPHASQAAGGPSHAARAAPNATQLLPPPHRMRPNRRAPQPTATHLISVLSSAARSFSTAGCMYCVWKAPATARRTVILRAGQEGSGHGDVLAGPLLRKGRGGVP